MKFIKLDLLTLLISLFLFASCENTSTIGLDIDPTNNIEGTLVDSLTVSSRTMMEAPTNTASLSNYPLGYLNDPIFGPTESSVAMSLALPSAAYNFGTTPTIDSAVLVLNYAGEFYGDSTQVYTISVNQLTNNIQNEESFLSNKVYPYDSKVIGTKTGRLFPTSKYKINDIVIGKKDTLKSVSPQIRIKLDNAFIQENFLNLTEATLKNDGVFKNFIRGLHVRVSNPSGNGAMMFLDFASTNSNLSLYYKKSNTVTTPASIDTVNVNFPLGNLTNRVAATVKHNYTGTTVETQLNNPNKQYTVNYLQPLVGLKSKISFPSLEKFSASAGNIVINKAELVLDLENGTDIKPFEAALRLGLYRYDIAEQRVNLEVYASDQTAVGGYFDPIKKRYVFNVTAYVQNLISKKTKDYGTFIAPIPFNTASEAIPNVSISSAARSVVGAHKKNPAVGESNMKLNLYYTKVK